MRILKDFNAQPRSWLFIWRPKPFINARSRSIICMETVQVHRLEQKLFYFLFFWRARVCWPLLCLCRPLLYIFWEISGFDPESCRTCRSATNLANHLPKQKLYLISQFKNICHSLFNGFPRKFSLSKFNAYIFLVYGVHQLALGTLEKERWLWMSWEDGYQWRGY